MKTFLTSPTFSWKKLAFRTRLIALGTALVTNSSY